MAALLVALARMDGYRFERGITRHNDIAAAAVFYGSLGGGFSPEIARDSLRECVRCCIIGDPMHIPGRSPARMASDYAWMLPGDGR